MDDASSRKRKEPASKREDEGEDESDRGSHAGSRKRIKTEDSPEDGAAKDDKDESEKESEKEQEADDSSAQAPTVAALPGKGAAGAAKRKNEDDEEADDDEDEEMEPEPETPSEDPERRGGQDGGGGRDQGKEHKKDYEQDRKIRALLEPYVGRTTKDGEWMAVSDILVNVMNCDKRDVKIDRRSAGSRLGFFIRGLSDLAERLPNKAVEDDMGDASTVRVMKARDLVALLCEMIDKDEDAGPNAKAIVRSWRRELDPEAFAFLALDETADKSEEDDDEDDEEEEEDKSTKSKGKKKQADERKTGAEVDIVVCNVCDEAIDEAKDPHFVCVTCSNFHVHWSCTPTKPKHQKNHHQWVRNAPACAGCKISMGEDKTNPEDCVQDPKTGAIWHKECAELEAARRSKKLAVNTRSHAGKKDAKDTKDKKDKKDKKPFRSNKTSSNKASDTKSKPADKTGKPKVPSPKPKAIKATKHKTATPSASKQSTGNGSANNKPKGQVEPSKKPQQTKKPQVKPPATKKQQHQPPASAAKADTEAGVHVKKEAHPSSSASSSSSSSNLSSREADIINSLQLANQLCGLVPPSMRAEADQVARQVAEAGFEMIRARMRMAAPRV